MPYVLPALPYAFDALEPHIDAQTMEIHHGKHHQTYVNNLNAALKDTPHEGQPVEALIAGADGSAWVAVGKEGLGLGPVELDASAPMPPLATSWHLLILGGTSRGAAASTTLCALTNPVSTNH